MLRLCSRISGAGAYFRRGHVAHLLQQRQVHVALDVAGRARVAVPVPGAAEVAALLDDPHVLHAGLAQPGADQQAAEAAADDGHLHLVEQRRAFLHFHIRVVEVVRELTLDLDVLLVGVGAQALVALGLVAVAQQVGVERVGHGGDCSKPVHGHPTRTGKLCRWHTI